MPRESDKFNLHDIQFPMIFQKNRLESFLKGGWPFTEKCACTPSKMAEAGFFYAPTPQSPDGVICFSCLKELDGWEPDDDPWKEHRKHTVDKGRECEFVTLGKLQSEMTVEDFLKIMKCRHISLVQELSKRKVEDFQKASDKIREELKKLGKTMRK